LCEKLCFLIFCIHGRLHHQGWWRIDGRSFMSLFSGTIALFLLALICITLSLNEVISWWLGLMQSPLVHPQGCTSILSHHQSHKVIVFINMISSNHKICFGQVVWGPQKPFLSLRLIECHDCHTSWQILFFFNRYIRKLWVVIFFFGKCSCIIKQNIMSFTWPERPSFISRLMVVIYCSFNQHALEC
jgi:hypothetical protein